MPILQIENPRKARPAKAKGGNVAKRGKLKGAAKAAFLARMAKGRGKSSARRPATKSPNRKARRSAKRATVAHAVAPRTKSRRRPWNKGKKLTHVKPIGSYTRKAKVAAHRRHVNPNEGGTMVRRRKRKTAKRKTNAAASARTNPRRRRSTSRRRKTQHRKSYRRRSNPNSVVEQIGTVTAGGAMGIGAGYLADAYGSRWVTNPLYRAAALVVAGLGLGGLVGRKRPDLGMALGVGIAGAGMGRAATKYIPQMAASASSPKQLSGVYDNMMGGVRQAPQLPQQQPFVREQAPQTSDANLIY